MKKSFFRRGEIALAAHFKIFGDCGKLADVINLYITRSYIKAICLLVILVTYEISKEPQWLSHLNPRNKAFPFRCPPGDIISDYTYEKP